MIVLGIETATPCGGAALWVDGGIVAEEANDGAVSHSQRLMPAIERVLQSATCELSAIDGIAVSIGPGSFTGLRIGLAIGKTLAHAEGKPIVAVSTLEALAWRAARADVLIAPMLDARRNEIFGAIFKSSDDGASLERLSSDVVERPEAFAERITEPVIAVGSGALRYAQLLQEHLEGRVIFAEGEINHPSAGVVAQLGARKLAEGLAANVLTLEPVYVRKSDAEISAARRLSKQ
jgi:tRNA threonylcarbamoyladenosine biosynthesis protein TsaB